MFLTGQSSDSVSEYHLTTAFDVSTASFDSSFSVSSEETAPMSVKFNNDGTKMFILGFTGQDVTEYTLSTAFDASTATYVSGGELDISSQESEP